MARVLDRIPLEEIQTRAATIDLKAGLLRLAAAPFMLIGFLAAFLFASVTWICGAALVGWDHGRQVTDRAGASADGSAADDRSG